MRDVTNEKTPTFGKLDDLYCAITNGQLSRHGVFCAQVVVENLIRCYIQIREIIGEVQGVYI